MSSEKSVKSYNRILWFYVIACIIISLLISWNDVKFFENELKENDNRVFSKIKHLEFDNKNSINYMNEVEKLILQRDIVLLYDLNNKIVVDSINVVVGEQFEEQVNKEIIVRNKQIKLDRNILDLKKITYIKNIQVHIDNTVSLMLNGDYVLYYIPKWTVSNNYAFERLSKSFSISCFFAAITVLFLDKIIKKSITK